MKLQELGKKQVAVKTQGQRLENGRVIVLRGLVLAKDIQRRIRADGMPYF